MALRLSGRLLNVLGLAAVGIIVLVFMALLFWPKADLTPPIFDVQMHYNRDAWHIFSPSAVIGTMKELGIRYAAVSSTPNEGTFRLYQENSLRVFPLLTPYQSIKDRQTWFMNRGLINPLRKALQSGRYRGIGEVHLLDGQVAGPVVQFVVEQAVARDMILLTYSDVEAIKQLYRLNPDLRILWAHAGITAQPLVIDNMMYKYPTLLAELSHRTDMLRDKKLKPKWRSLLLRYSRRFMVGTDTYDNSIWYEYRYTIGRIRKWLQELPPDVAEDIGHRNAVRLFARKERL